MRYAETGYDLEVDLTTGNIERVESDPELTLRHIGGNGVAAKIIWDRVPPETDPLSPDNLLIVSAGLMAGTPVPTANRTLFNTISPVTNYFSNSIMGGYFAPELKHAGYDRIIFTGKADKLVYLYINNDTVELRDAAHLSGLGAQATAYKLKDELGDQRLQVAAIGQAGESRVYFASVEHSNASASRGVGVVMGDKRLKAIAVRGTKDFQVAHPEECFNVCLKHSQDIGTSPLNGDLMAIEWNDAFHHDNFAWGNARVRQRGYWSQALEDRWKEYTLRIRDRLQGCYNCPKNCHLVVKPPGRQRYILKCYGKGVWHMAAFKEIEFSFDAMAVSQELGYDTYAASQTIAYALELYDVGILTDEDLPDFPEDSADRFFYMMDMIAHRRGIGDKFADGMWRAARSIGRGAEQWEHNCIKKFEQLPLKLGKINYTYYLMYCCSDKMAINQSEGSYPQDATSDPTERQKFVDEWISAPERFKKFYMEWEPRANPTMEAAMHIADWNEIMHYMDDSTGLCAFCSSFRGQFGGGTAYHIYNVPYFLKLTHGMDIDSEDLWRICRRNRNLVRAINVSRGLRRDDERPPEDHWAIREPENEETLIHGYYEFKGWTSEGIPSKDTLDSLGLDYVADELIRRGILTGQETEGKYVELPLYTAGMSRESTTMVRKVEEYTLTNRLKTEKYEGKDF